MPCMAGQAVYRQLRQVEFQVQRWRPGLETERAAQKAFATLLRRVQMASAVARDYEMSEFEEDTRAQLRLLPRVVKELEAVREALLKASEYDLVGAVDVAQLSAQLDELSDSLR